MSNLNDELLLVFKEEAEELLSTWESCSLNLGSEDTTEVMKEMFRAAHTLKGSSKTVGLEEFGNFVHKIEDLLKLVQTNPHFGTEKRFIDILFASHKLMESWLDQGDYDVAQKSQIISEALQLMESFGGQPSAEPIATQEVEKSSDTPKKAKKPAVEVVRVNKNKINKMINFVGELGTQLAVLDHHFNASSVKSQESKEALEYCMKYIKSLQEYTIGLSMQPIDRFLQRLESSCKDVARSTEKEINVTKIGATIELDKTVLDQIADPFIHLVRNAADHGVEPPAERIASGKPKEGHITIAAEQKSGAVQITVSDDGKGLDRDAILRKAVEKGLVDDPSSVDEDAIYQLVMNPGFSTKEAVTEISGRGVGLDVVSETLRKLGGSLRIESEKGLGTKFIVSVPTNFSMVEAILVNISGNHFAIPLKDFSEVVDLSDFGMQGSQENNFFKMREEVISLYDVNDFLNLEANENYIKPHNRAAVINRSENHPVAFEIDKILGRQNLFVKPLQGQFSEMVGVAGSSIFPDGQAGLILNLSDIVKHQIELVRGQKKYG